MTGQERPGRRTMPDRSTAPESTGRSCPPQLGNRQPDVTSLGGQQTGPVCRSASSTGPGHADNARRRSPRSPRHRSTPAAPARRPCGSIDIATGTDRVKQLGPVKLREGHRKPPFSRTWSFSRRSPGGPTQRWTPASTPLPRTSTHRCGRHGSATLLPGASRPAEHRLETHFAPPMAERWRKPSHPGASETQRGRPQHGGQSADVHGMSRPFRAGLPWVGAAGVWACVGSCARPGVRARGRVGRPPVRPAPTAMVCRVPVAATAGASLGRAG
jgi:hypothetical protein